MSLEVRHDRTIMSECQPSAEAEWMTLRDENRRRFRRRVGTVGTVLLVAAGIEQKREIGLWVCSRWYDCRTNARTIDAQSARHLFLGGDAILLDVRSVNDFNVSHVEGAWSLPLERLEDGGWPRNWPKGKVVIAYCTLGAESGRAAELLDRRYGIRAYSLSGGLLGLANVGEPFIAANGLTWRVSIDAGSAWLLPREYQPVDPNAHSGGERNSCASQ